MINNRLAKVVAAMALAPMVANAHMRMSSPTPFGEPSKSPLDPSGSNFPCQNIGYTGSASNNWPVGSTQQLTFHAGDSAIHGGGSCQISVTTDKAPTKSSKWKVIHSIEGGCPYNAAGNLPEAGSQTIPSYPFTVPKALPNGDMAMAWTWFNRIGNREMYMNCAPITVTGGSSDTTAFDALPDMAIANINVGTGATCHTTENFEYIFANPGSSVVNGMSLNPSGGTYQFEPLCGGSPTSGPTGGSAPAGSGAPAGSAPAASAPAATKPAGAATTMKTVAGGAAQTPAPGKGAPAGQSQGVSAPAAQPTAPAAAQPSAPAAQPSSPSGGNSSSGPGTSSGSSCSPDGALICQGESMFAICSNGQATFMAVAEGTSCKAGVISKRSTHMHRHRHIRRSF